MMWFFALQPSEVRKTTLKLPYLNAHTRSPYTYICMNLRLKLASVAQLVRALHQNRRAVGSIPTRGPAVLHISQLGLKTCKLIRL